MVTFFISISFFIHVLSLAAIYVLYKQGQQSKSNQAREIDQLMHSYLTKIQQENSELQEALHKQSTHERKKQDKSVFVTPEETESMDVREDKRQDSKKQWNPTSIIDRTEDTIETSLESRVLQLHRDGMSVNDIARKLHCGETEVSLIIQFQSKE